MFQLDLVLLEPILPDRCIGCDAILAEIDQDVHRVLLHRLTHIQIVVVIVCHDLLHCTGCRRLELLHLVVLALRLQFLENLFEIFFDASAIMCPLYSTFSE